MMKLFVRLLLAVSALTLPAISAPAGQPAPKWDHWYTVTILPSTPYAYYRETIESPNGRLHFKTQMWKQEEGYINEEQLGAFALDNEILTPLFFNFHSTYRTSELMIDGTANESQLKIRIKKDGADKPVITKVMPSKTIFSSLFPVWLRKQLLKKQTSGSFLAVLEDNESIGFSAVSGSYKMVENDDFSKSSGSTRIEVNFSDNKSYWYLDSNGSPIRIEMPAQKTRVERVTEAKAKSFFKAKKDGP